MPPAPADPSTLDPLAPAHEAPVHEASVHGAPRAAPVAPPPDDALDVRAARLAALLREMGSVCVGYSGGVDSAYLAVAAVDALGAERVLAVTGLSPAYPGVQRDTALEVARAFGVRHEEIPTDELADPHYAANPSNRCYFCKTELWERLGALARRRGLAVVVDGSNADDLGDHRPGALAAREHGVRSPLQEAGLSKADIRALSRARGLPTWDQPAAPCLASRLPYGLAVTPERLAQVEAAESAVRALGFREFRVRHHGEVARLEVVPADAERAVAAAERLAAGVRAAGFRRAALDAEGYRRGALNEGLVTLQTGGASLPKQGLARLETDGAGSAAPEAGSGAGGAAGNGSPHVAHVEMGGEPLAALLADAGIPGHAAAAGFRAEVALVATGRGHLAAVADRAAAIRALGFRYVTVDLEALARDHA